MHRPLRLLLALAFAAALVPAAASAAGPRQIRITLTDRVTLERVIQSGLDVVTARPGVSADVFAWPGDEPVLAALGADVTVVDEDPGLHAAERARRELAARPRPVMKRVWSATGADGGWRFDAYPPAGSGSLGGFWTLAEVKMKLDDLVASDTQDLVADKLDTIGTSLQGRPIWALTLGKPVAGPDTRPVAYFNALTHAREPGGMHALFNFVDDLLARYGTDPVATYLLEQRRIVICPVVNPDGYWYNQRIYDSTAAFGLWRKNLRDNNANGRTDSGDGVDINRNFGYRWGYNNSGSSGTASSDVYRGPAAWSEPETRVQRDEFSALRAVAGFSFHTYSDLYVHPWGWTTTGTPDSAKFQTWTDEFSLTNGFAGGPGPRILYDVNGEFSDWTYGDTLLKPKAYTWTPEVGGADDGFWPPPSRLNAINESVLRSCWNVAGITGPWLKVDRVSVPEGWLNAGNYAHVLVRARNIGASGQAGPGLQAALTPIDAGVTVLSGPTSYPNMGSFTTADPDTGSGFWVTAADTVTPGRMVRFQVDWTDAAGLFCRDTVELVVGTPTVLVNDASQSLAGWVLRAGTWGVKTNDPVHPDAYIADSPNGVYSNNYAGQLRYNGTLDLSSGVHAWAFFEDRYAFEQEYDAGLFEASTDTVTWTALPGNGAVTSPAISIAGAGKKVFGGTRWRWRQDRVDLSAYAGDAAHKQLRLRWRSLSDGGTNFDGMNFDSLRVYVYDPAMQPAPVAAVVQGPPATRLRLAPPSPNPARGSVAFAFETPATGEVRLEILDVQGRVVTSHTAALDAANGSTRYAWGWDLRDRAGRPVAPGVYLVHLRSGRESATQRVIVLP